MSFSTAKGSPNIRFDFVEVVAAPIGFGCAECSVLNDLGAGKVLSEPEHQEEDVSTAGGILVNKRVWLARLVAALVMIITDVLLLVTHHFAVAGIVTIGILVLYFVLVYFMTEDHEREGPE